MRPHVVMRVTGEQGTLVSLCQRKAQGLPAKQTKGEQTNPAPRMFGERHAMRNNMTWKREEGEGRSAVKVI